MPGDDFERALRKALSGLPPAFREALDNVAVVVEEWPPDWLLDELGIPPEDTLYGFYHGIPLPERSIQDSGNLPDKICIYRGPLGIHLQVTMLPRLHEDAPVPRPQSRSRSTPGSLVRRAQV